jgi:hypothetical protein
MLLTLPLVEGGGGYCVLGGVLVWGGGMRRKRRHTLLKIINRLSANALSGVGSRTVWSITSGLGSDNASSALHSSRIS